MRSIYFTILILAILLGGACFTVFLEHHFHIPKYVSTFLDALFGGFVGTLLINYHRRKNKTQRNKTIEEIREEKINKIIKRF